MSDEKVLKPSIAGILFAVEEAIRNGDCPWEIEQAFETYEVTRRAIVRAAAEIGKQMGDE